MLKLLNKKVLIIFLIALFVLTGLAVYFLYQKQAETIPSVGEKKEETLAEKQLKELEELRKQADIKPLTPEQEAAQLKELEALRKKANIKPLTQTQIQKQLEELEKLRLAQ